MHRKLTNNNLLALYQHEFPCSRPSKTLKLILAEKKGQLIIPWTF